MKNTSNKSKAAILRKKAEKLLEKKSLKTVTQLTETETLKLIHELEVHQIELELQNEELMLAKKLVEEAATEKYAELYDFAPSGYFTLSTEGEIIDLNLCGSQMLGKERLHLKNSRFGFFVSDDTRQIYNQFLRKLFDSKTKESCDVALKANDSLTMYVHLTGIATENGEHCLVTAIDITKRKQAETELIKAKDRAEESDRLKTAFLQNMSHEIRTPMNAIIGFSKMLEKSDLSEEIKKSYTNIIIEGANHLLFIISDILTISALETKQEKVNIKKVCINKIIVELLEIFKPQASNQNVHIYANPQLTDKLSEIYTDKTKVTHILTNLLNNALKFTQQGYIEFGYNLKDSDLEFYVKDTGIGIKKEMHDIIFEHFRQANEKTTKKYGGNGLGLSISKAFTELLGGKIHVESKHGRGSTFYFTIPYKPAYENDDLISKTKPVEKTTTILIAEDEVYNYLYLEELLTKLNLRLIHTTDGKETVEICKSNPDIHLILMDIKMPVLDGYTAAKQIKKLRPQLPIIAQSAYAFKHKIEKKSQPAFDDYIAKPIDKDELKHKLMKYIGKQMNDAIVM